MLKKTVAISLFIFFVGTTSILTAGLIMREKNKNNPAINTNAQITGDTTNKQPLANNTNTSILILDMIEITKHDKASDCWLLISGKVYDVTSYLNSGHPGGRQSIINTCGTDSTKDYQTKDKVFGTDHSRAAYSMLNAYYIGNLNQKINIQTNISPTNKTTPTANNTNTNIVSTPSPTTIPNTNIALTSLELAKHNKSSDCWLLISGKIYNVTGYIRSHPGGANEIIKFCGIDSTSAYQTKDGRGNNHSQAAYAMLTPYYIGTLNQNITTQQLNTSVIQTNTTPPPANSGEREDD